MSNALTIQKKIKNFKKYLIVSGDKSISIRWVLFLHCLTEYQKQKIYYYLKMYQQLSKQLINWVLNQFKNNEYKIYGRGINGFKYKKNITIDAKNSGTLGRFILGLLINSPYEIKLIGDKSLSNRDFKRISDPLTEFGAKFNLKKIKIYLLKFVDQITLNQ